MLFGENDNSLELMCKASPRNVSKRRGEDLDCEVYWAVTVSAHLEFKENFSLVLDLAYEHKILT